MSTRTAPAKTATPSKSKVAPKAAERAVAAAEAVEPIGWAAVEDAYLATEEASEAASNFEGTGDDAVFEANKPIHKAWRTARDRLMDTPAPNWAALALKASVFLRMWDDSGAADTRWLKAAKDFSDAALKIGPTDLAEANPVDVMSARGYAEQLCYYLANDEDGYRAWAVSLGGVGQLASEAEGIASESRRMAHATAAQRSLSAEVISAVWFGQSAFLDAQDQPTPLSSKDGDCEVAQQADRFAKALVRHSELDGKRGAVVEAECDAQWHLMVAAEESAQAGQPTSHAGVAFQLLCAVGEIEAVENGRDEQVKLDAGEKIRTAVSNAIAGLDLPHDAKTAAYFLGDRLAKRLAQ